MIRSEGVGGGVKENSRLNDVTLFDWQKGKRVKEIGN